MQNSTYSIANDLQFEYLQLGRSSLCDEIDTIRSIIHPQPPSVMNINISSVLYNSIKNVTEKTDSSTKCLFISGLGPDELLGGYSKFKLAHPEDEINVLQMWNNTVSICAKELNELFSRNCHRENRISDFFNVDILAPFLDIEFISCCLYLHNFPYYPFLLSFSSKIDDEKLIKLISSYNKELLQDSEMEPIISSQIPRDKFIQRVYMYRKGLHISLVSRIKRAAQFGSNAAKVYGRRKQSGSEDL